MATATPPPKPTPHRSARTTDSSRGNPSTTIKTSKTETPMPTRSIVSPIVARRGRAGEAVLLGRQSIALPSVGRFHVGDAVVQPTRPALPKLDAFGRHVVPAPVVGQRDDFALVLGIQRRETFLQDLAIGDHGRLTTGPRAELTLAGTRMKVGFAPPPIGADGPALDTDLAFQVRPKEAQRNGGVLGNLTGFDGFVIRKKDEPVILDSLQ